MRLVRPVALILALSSGGCDSGKTDEVAAPPSGTPQVQAPRTPPEPPPTPGKAIEFEAADGTKLSGDAYLVDGAPGLVLVHRPHSDRHEWDGLVDRLRRGQKRYSILNFDLRGHGKSAAPKGFALSNKSAGALAQDLRAAILEIVNLSHSERAVVVGSSYGATMAATIAYDEPRLSALAMISPGAAIMGVDIYKPYAEVRNIPTFIAWAKEDGVSREPGDALGRMAMKGTLTSYEGRAHSAGLLGAEHAELFDDLKAWLTQVFDVKPEERRSLYYAPGKEPKTKRSTGSGS